MASAGSSGEIFNVTSNYGWAVNKICLTFIALELLAARKALPKHMASSPLRCTFNSLSFIYDFKISVTFGVLIPPPRSST